ncbi:MAG: DUF5403 family protein [Arthrobacter sp.]
MSDHIIEWKTPSGAPATLRGKNSVEDTVSHLEPVHAAVKRKAYALGAEAEAHLAAHHRTGAAHIKVDRHPHAGARTPDWYVYLVDRDPGGSVKGVWRNQQDRSAMSIEFGWTQTRAFGKKMAQPKHHDGLHILGDAIGRAAARYTGPK